MKPALALVLATMLGGCAFQPLDSEEMDLLLGEELSELGVSPEEEGDALVGGTLSPTPEQVTDPNPNPWKDLTLPTRIQFDPNPTPWEPGGSSTPTTEPPTSTPSNSSNKKR
ncbi:hypothetical protein [Chondromyces crocatus]|uniref:hypothetical protein n=1 Tax=Chondromyces crocatus TaxID=52 RepID=UPI00067DA8ED|nr:hypothetical protein [Chondromyces crocatus]